MTRLMASHLTALALEVATVETKIKIVATLTVITEIEEIETDVAQTETEIAHANVGTATTIDIETEKTEIELIATVETIIAHLGTTVAKGTEEMAIAVGMILETTNAAKKEDEKMKTMLDLMESAERKIVKTLLEIQGVRGGTAPRILTREDATGIGRIAQIDPSIRIVMRKLASFVDGTGC